LQQLVLLCFAVDGNRVVWFFAAFNVLLLDNFFLGGRCGGSGGTREIFGHFAFSHMISFFSSRGPAIERYSHKPAPGIIRGVERLFRIPGLSPPGLVAASINY